MRKTLTSEMRRQRCQRRAVLAALIFATAAPSNAAESTSGSLRIVSPLPLTANTNASRVQGNPFCELTLVPLSNPLVQTTSDHQPSPIRMKPIGVAGGLRSIGEPDSPAPPAILITPPTASPIQINPLIGSMHHNNAPASEVAVTDSASPNSHIPEAHGAVITAPPQPQVLSFEPVIESEVDTIDRSLDEGSLNEDTMSAVEAVQEPASDELDGQDVASLETESGADDLDPVIFSLSDFDQQHSDSDQQPAESKKSTSEDPDSIARSSGLGGIKPVTIDDPVNPPTSNPPTSNPPTSNAPISATEPLPSNESLAPSQPAVAMAEPLVPIDFSGEMLPSLKTAPGDIHSNETVKKSGSGVVASLVSNTNRYRPPVAVSTSSVPLIRNESTEGISLVRPAVTRVESLNLDNAQPMLADIDHSHTLSPVVQTSAAIDLHMNKAQVRTLTIGGTFRRISLADQAICQAINSGSNELKLIGTGCGVTELTIWADTGNGQPPKVRVFRIHVEDAVDTQGEAVSDKAETLNQSIARAFPNCRVQLRQENGQLVVAGNCDSDKSASDILRMVRKTRLIPVVDELRIR